MLLGLQMVYYQNKLKSEIKQYKFLKDTCQHKSFIQHYRERENNDNYSLSAMQFLMLIVF